MNPLYAMIDGYKIDEDYSMSSEEYRNLLLKNNLSNNIEFKNTTTFGQRRDNNIVIDPETEYSFNNFGYRDIDWTDNAEIIGVGCSNTWGFGVLVEGRWTNILEKKLNKKIRNLSFPGASINELIAKLFEHFKIFGNPKTMLCLFPDPFRIKLPHRKNLNDGNFIKKIPYKDIEYDIDLYLSDVLFDHEPEIISKRNQYFKLPYSYGDILPLDLPVFFSMQSIHMLEQYCKSNNIKLIWSFWHSPTVDVLNNTKDKIFNNFVYNKDLIIGHHLVNGPEDFGKICHQEYKNEFEKYFDMGRDIELGLNFAHPGVHKHIHIAEAFYEEINK